MSLRLHPEYGVNPTIPTCFYCGEEKNEIALLGIRSKKITGKEEAPMHGPCLDMEPCDKCKEYMKMGIILIGVDESKSDDMQNPYRTGEFLVVSEDWVKRAISPPELRDHILEKRMAFVPGELAAAMIRESK